MEASGLWTGQARHHAPTLHVTGISAGGHALVRLPPTGPSEAEIVTGAARRDIALAGLGHYRHGTEPESDDDHGPALVVGYATPAGRSHRAAISALGRHLASYF
jgi:GntR family transcriptional regulator/MocR family aminotransferase